MAAHWHPFHQVIVVNRGVFEVTIAGQSVRATAGDVLFYHAGLVHEERSNRRSPASTTFFSIQVPDCQAIPVCTRDQGGRIRELAAWLKADHFAHADKAHLTHLALAVIHQIQRLHSTPNSPWLESIRQQMREHLATDLDLDTVAAWGGLSKFAFVRKYKSLCGHPPMRDLRLMRLDQARTLLLTTALPIKAIAETAHLGNESQFSKLFHHYQGMWPGELRRRPTKPKSRRLAQKRGEPIGDEPGR